MLVRAWPTIRSSQISDDLGRLVQLDLDVRARRRAGRTPPARSSSAASGGEARRGHAGEGRELVDHPADVADLADDGVGAAVEGLQILVISLRYCARSRSADSWIGVSGFLISWAMRRATSLQAALRWAATRRVMSSKVSTRPSAGVAGARTRSRRVSPPRITSISSSTWAPAPPAWATVQLRRRVGQRLAQAASPQVQQRRRPAVEAEMRPPASRPIDAGADARQHGLDELPPRLGVVAGVRSAACCACRSPVMLLKASDRTGFPRGRLAVDPRVKVAARHPAGRVHQPRDGPAIELAAAIPTQTAPTSTSSAVSI